MYSSPPILHTPPIRNLPHIASPLLLHRSHNILIRSVFRGKPSCIGERWTMDIIVKSSSSVPPEQAQIYASFCSDVTGAKRIEGRSWYHINVLLIRRRSRRSRRHHRLILWRLYCHDGGDWRVRMCTCGGRGFKSTSSNSGKLAAGPWSAISPAVQRWD